MSTSPQTSAAMRIFVPVYLAVIGAALLVGAGYIFLYMPDEPFVTILGGLGGLTMWATAAAMLTVARNR